MPTMVIPDGYAEIGIDFLRTGGTRLMAITFGVKLKAAPTPAGIQTDVKNAWTVAGSMNGGQPTSVVAQTVHYKATYGGVALSGTAAAGWAAGGGGPTLASPAVCFVVKKLTGIAGRKYRGRMMLPWIAETNIDAHGLVTAADITNWNVALVKFLAELDLAGRAQLDGMVLLHSDATPPTPVISLIMRGTAGTVRKRQSVA